MVDDPVIDGPCLLDIRPCGLGDLERRCLDDTIRGQQPRGTTEIVEDSAWCLGTFPRFEQVDQEVAGGDPGGERTA